MENLYYAKLMAVGGDHKYGGGVQEGDGAGNGGVIHDVVSIANIVDTLLLRHRGSHHPNVDGNNSGGLSQVNNHCIFMYAILHIHVYSLTYSMGTLSAFMYTGQR